MSNPLDEEARYIPADIKRAVLVEAGHACAIPTCQFPATEFAHIVPYAQMKRHEVSNIIALCPNHHTLFDQKKAIDRKAMKMYKLNLQFLNQRYTKYELRLLSVLAEKPSVVASGEIEAMGLLRDGLVENSQTFESHSILSQDTATGSLQRHDQVLSFEARLTDKGREFISTWKSDTDNLLDAL
jgi:hypothetical protein